MAALSNRFSAFLNDSWNSSHSSGHSESDDNDRSCEEPKMNANAHCDSDVDDLSCMDVSINDLPREVMEIIFEELYSITQKKIERVCTRWMEIIRGTKSFRTHLLIELPSTIHNPHGYRRSFVQDFWTALRQLVNPDVEVLHFKSQRPPSDLDLEWTPVHGVEIGRIMNYSGGFGAIHPTVNIVFSDCTLLCAFWDNTPHILNDIRKIRIVRSHITAEGWCLFSETLKFYFEDWVGTFGELTQQMKNLLTAMQGPLTKAQSDILRGLERRLTDNVQLIHPLAGYLSRLEREMKFMENFNWIEALTAVGNGGQISRHMADFLTHPYFAQRIDNFTH